MNFNYDLENFDPIVPEDIYVRLYSLEQEIKRHEPDLYFKIKEFTYSDDGDISYYDINHFAESLSHQIYRKRKLDPQWLKAGEEAFQSLLEELCFEVLYPKLFSSAEPAQEENNIKTQQKVFIMQNLVTPQLLGIKEEHYALNVFQLASHELKKVNSVKSPSNKCRALMQSINCLTSKRG